MTHDTTVLPPVHDARAHRRRSLAIRSWADVAYAALAVFFVLLDVMLLGVIAEVARYAGWL